MKCEVYEFQVKEQYEIIPQITQSAFIDEFYSFQNVFIQILGDANSSLIAINEVASFFDVSSETNYEWHFTKCNYVLQDTFIAIVYAF